MKLGPIHVVTDATMATMQGMIHRLASELAEARNSDSVMGQLEALRKSFYPHMLHPPTKAKFALPFSGQPDEENKRSEEAVQRVIAAYNRASAELQRPAPCMWELGEARNAKSFVAALKAGNAVAVFEHLRSMFRTNLVWGLGCVCEQVWNFFLTQSYGPYLMRFTDILRSLAEAVGTLCITNSEQDMEGHFSALDIDTAATYSAIEHQIGLDLSFPEVGGAYGCVIGDSKTSIDSLIHAYTVTRMIELGAKPKDSVAEIGGGYGSLALLMYRAGFRNYSIYDLPWVCALQGYFLIMSLPPGSVRLYGEDSGDVSILPGWRFDRIPNRSIDYVINTNSFPEMGRATAIEYLKDIRRSVKKQFLSINQEAKVAVDRYDPQLCVAELMQQVGGFRRLSRSKYWMRNGYVEEVYQPESI